MPTERRSIWLVIAAVVWVLVGLFFIYPSVIAIENRAEDFQAGVGLTRTLAPFAFVAIPVMCIVGGILTFVKKRYVFLSLPLIGVAIWIGLPVINILFGI